MPAELARLAGFSGNPDRSLRPKPSATATALRDLAADWKRWTLPERATAVATVVLIVLLVALVPVLTEH